MPRKKTPPRNPEGGWLPPNRKDYRKFWEDVQEQALQRFGVDEDNEACVKVILIDKSREEYFHFQPIPREIEESPYHPYGRDKWGVNGIIPTKHTPEENEARHKAILENKRDIGRMISLNFKVASDRVDRFMREYEFDIRDKIERPEKERLARIKTLEHKKLWWADPVKSLRDSGYIVDEEKGVYWNQRTPENIRPIQSKPENFDVLMIELERLKAYKPAKTLDL